jgi:hypothetical protein
MPGLDGRGPLGAGAMTGRGLGRCSGNGVARYGVGLGLGLGCAAAGAGYRLYRNRRFRADMMPTNVGATDKKEDLLEMKKVLEDRLKAINSEIEEA